MFSCEFFEIFKKTFFLEHIRRLLLEVFCKSSVWKYFVKFTGKQLYQSRLFSSQAKNAQLYWKIDFRAGVFSVKFMKFFRIINFAERLGDYFWILIYKSWGSQVQKHLPEMFLLKMVFFKISQNSQENTCLFSN